MRLFFLFSIAEVQRKLTYKCSADKVHCLVKEYLWRVVLHIKPDHATGNVKTCICLSETPQRDNYKDCLYSQTEHPVLFNADITS